MKARLRIRYAGKDGPRIFMIWAADIYDMGGGVAIVTGYAPFGNIHPAYELRKWYETQAEKIRYDYNLSYDQQREDLKILARDFIRGVCSHG